MHYCWVWDPTDGAFTGNVNPLGWRVRRMAKSVFWYAVCKAMQLLLTQYCPMLLYLGHLVRRCN